MRTDAAILLGFNGATEEPDGSDFRVEGRAPTAEELTAINLKADWLTEETNGMSKAEFFEFFENQRTK